MSCISKIHILIRVLKKVYRNFGINIRVLYKNIRYNFHRYVVNMYDGVMIVAKNAQLRIDVKGQLVLTAPLYFGKKIFDNDSMCASIWIMDGGKIDVCGSFTIHNGAFIHIRKGGHLILKDGYINWGCNICL